MSNENPGSSRVFFSPINLIGAIVIVCMWIIVAGGTAAWLLEG